MKKALLVGINYPGTSSQLNGCINDVVLMSQVLTEKFGFTDPLNKRMLTDNSATTSAIFERLNWLVDGAQSGDTLFFHYSGHGSQTIDTDYNLQEEPDSMDEIICPADLDWRTKVIKDDHFRAIFGRLPQGVNLTVVLDCCHSGQGLRSVPMNPYEGTSPNRPKFVQAPPDIMNRGVGMDLTMNRVMQNVSVIEEQRGVLISGCASNQTSADAWIHNKYHGACTYYLWEVLRDNDWRIGNADLVNLMNDRMDKYKYTQNPELNCSSGYVNSGFLL